jgi:hypothetical protein
MAAAIRARSLLHATRPPWSVGAGWLGSWRSVVLFWWLLLSLLARISVRASSCPIGGAGNSHTCIADQSGRAKCWGANDKGQLGYGTVNARGDISTDFMGDSLAAVSLGTGRSVRAAASGQLHSCVILDDGRLKCFGLNSFGQLGQGDTIIRGDGPGEMGDNLTASVSGHGPLRHGRRLRLMLTRA